MVVNGENTGENAQSMKITNKFQKSRKTFILRG